MTLKKLLTGTVIGIMVLMVVPVLDMQASKTTMVEAAKFGARITPTPKITPAPATPAPKSNLNKKPANESKSVSGAGKTYTPSKNAKDLPANAPTAATKPNNGSSFGNTLRNIGIFAGGMMLGGLIGSVLGNIFGGLGDFFGEFLGMLFNVILIYAAFKGFRYLWNRFQANKAANNYSQPIDITPKQDYISQQSLGSDYDPKRTADRYRSL